MLMKIKLCFIFQTLCHLRLGLLTNQSSVLGILKYLMHDIEQLAFISTDIAALLCCGFITPICRVFFAKASGLGEISVLNCALNKLRIEFSLKFSWSIHRQVRTEAFEAIITAAIEALVYDKYNEANRKFRKKIWNFISWRCRLGSTFCCTKYFTERFKSL